MGLLSGHRNEPTTTTGTHIRYIHAPHANPTQTGVGHRYETRSHGKLSSGPGTTTTTTGRTGGLFGSNRTNNTGTTTSEPLTGNGPGTLDNGLGTTGTGRHSVGTGRRGMGTNTNAAVGTGTGVAANSKGHTGSKPPHPYVPYLNGVLTV